MLVGIVGAGGAPFNLNSGQGGMVQLVRACASASASRTRSPLRALTGRCVLSCAEEVMWIRESHGIRRPDSQSLVGAVVILCVHRKIGSGRECLLPLASRIIAVEIRLVSDGLWFEAGLCAPRPSAARRRTGARAGPHTTGANNTLYIYNFLYLTDHQQSHAITAQQPH